MYPITLIPGDGIGAEVSFAAKRVLDATGLPLLWDIVNAGAGVYKETGHLVPPAVYESLEKNKLALKGPITTPVGAGFRSINVQLRKKYDLFANIRPVSSLPLESCRYDHLDLVIFRENTEGLYAGIESEIDGGAQAIKQVTAAGSQRIIRRAFQYALENKKQKVTVVHKANILKKTDGLFLDIARSVAKDFPSIAMEEVIVDNMCMQLVMNPDQYQVIVTMNLYGDILSDLCSGLVGGLGLVPGANIGRDMAIFEAVHGSAPDIAGKGLANPIALILSGAMMLDYIGEQTAADQVRHAINQVLQEGRVLTRDLGGNADTDTLVEAIIGKMKETVSA